MCVVVYCPSLGSPENGQAITELGFGSRAEYSCSEGYALVGNGERVCQSDGTWSGSDPECECEFRVETTSLCVYDVMFGGVLPACRTFKVVSLVWTSVA